MCRVDVKIDIRFAQGTSGLQSSEVGDESGQDSRSTIVGGRRQGEGRDRKKLTDTRTRARARTHANTQTCE